MWLRLMLVVAAAVVGWCAAAPSSWGEEPEPSPTSSVVTGEPSPWSSSEPSPSSLNPSPVASDSVVPSSSPTVPGCSEGSEGACEHVWTNDEATAVLVGLCLLILLASVHVVGSWGR